MVNKVITFLTVKKGNSKYALYEKILMRLITSWFFVYSLEVFKKRDYLRNIFFTSDIELPKYLISIVLCFIIICEVMFLLKREWLDTALFLSIVTLACVNLALKQNTFLYLVGIIGILILAITYIMNKYEYEINLIKLSEKKTKILIFTFSFLWIAVLLLFAICRYLCFYSPEFDFGIFSQMFYYMKEDFIPYTTCERVELMSHLNVHMSPTLYILLPIYFIFPYQITILVLQVLLVASAVIPLYLLCKKNKLSNIAIAIVCLVFIFYPTNMCGLYYDFHENKMLLPIIMWLLYFLDLDDKEKEKSIWTKKNIGILVFFILLLGVKEDASIYAACIGIYIFVFKKEYRRGAALTGIAVAYFIIVVAYLNHFGDGAMTGRYSNYMLGDRDSLANMIIALFENPAILLNNIAETDRYVFALWMFLPVMFMPFKTKKYSELVLLIPLLLINLMPNWKYQYDIYFQYSYGTSAIIMFMTVKHISGNEQIIKKKTLAAMLAASMILGIGAMSSKLYYIKSYFDNKEVLAKVETALETVPEEASVEASSYYLTHLANRRELYLIRDDYKADYVVFDLRFSLISEEYNKNIQQYIEDGYIQTEYVAGQIVILKLQK